MSRNKNAGRIEWMRRFALGRPVIFSILVILVSALLTEIRLDVVFSPWVGEPSAEFLRVIVEHTLTGLLLLWLLVKLGMLQDARFTPPGQWKAVWLVWPLALIALLGFSSLIDGSLVIDTARPGVIALYALLNLSIGFCEEVMGRGVVLSLMLRKWGHTRRGIYLAVVASSVLFGAAHICNLIVGHLPLLSNLTQIVYSLYFGVIFAACFLRNNSIWPVMILHALVDFGGGLRHIAVGGGNQAAAPNNTIEQAAVSLIITLPLLLHGLFILRKVAPSESPGGAGSLVSQAEMSTLS
jgi:membrane protease YdiL (CAAX protease family)